jgi:hypothetical protein
MRAASSAGALPTRRRSRPWTHGRPGMGAAWCWWARRASARPTWPMGWAAQAGALILDRGATDVSAANGRPVLMEDVDRGVDPETLFHLINMAGHDGGSLLLTARLAPAAWPAELPDLRSRLNALPVALIEEPDDEVLEAVLRKFFRERSIRPPKEVFPICCGGWNGRSRRRARSSRSWMRPPTRNSGPSRARLRDRFLKMIRTILTFSTDDLKPQVGWIRTGSISSLGNA